MDDADIEGLAELRAKAIASRRRPAPVFVIENFLHDDVHETVLSELISCEDQFWSNLTAGRDSLALVNPQSVAPVQAEIKRRFEEILSVVGALGAPVHDVNRCHLEAPTVNAAGHANFHAPHIDNDAMSGVEAVFTRRISLVWHAFRNPQQFNGGELRLWDYSDVASERGPWTPAATWTDYPCTDNSLIAFSSYSLHEVLPVQMFNGEFADRRFAVITAAHAS